MMRRATGQKTVIIIVSRANSAGEIRSCRYTIYYLFTGCAIIQSNDSCLFAQNDYRWLIQYIYSMVQCIAMLCVVLLIEHVSHIFTYNVMHVLMNVEWMYRM